MELRQRRQALERAVQAEIRHDIAEFPARKLLPELGKPGEDFGGRGDKIELRVGGAQIVCQQIGMDDDAVLRRGTGREQAAERVAGTIGEVLRAEQGIAERQAGGDAVFPRQRQDIPRVLIAKADTTAAPDAAGGRAVDRADGAPVVEIVPVGLEQG